jgi:hypothetical protein
VARRTQLLVELLVKRFVLRAAVVAALVAAVVWAGAVAGDAVELPRTAARRAVEQGVHSSYPDLVFGNVACPGGVARARGVAFTCTVQLPGTFLVVDAKQTDGNGTVSLSTQQAVIPTQALRDFVAKNASLAATVDCGPAPVRVLRANQTVACQAKLTDGTVRTVVLTVQDSAGNVTITSVT